MTPIDIKIKSSNATFDILSERDLNILINQIPIFFSRQHRLLPKEKMPL